MLNLYLLRKLDVCLGKFYSLTLRPKPHYKDEVNYKRILLIKLWGLGNLTIIFPLIYKIKQKYPDSLIFFLTFDLNRGFLEKNEAIDKVVYFKYSKNIFKIAFQFIFVLKKLKGERIDTVVNFETFNNASALFSCLTGAPLRIGLDNKFEKIFYCHPIKHNSGLHISQTFSNLLRPLEINSAYTYFRFAESKEDKLKVEHILKSLGVERFICVHPGTSENFCGKRYNKDYFSALADLLIDKYHLPVLFTGTGKERQLLRHISKRASRKDKAYDLSGSLTIWEFVELLRKSALFISNDTGPVHLAASLGINSAVFYGPTTPKRYGPLNKNSLIFYKNIACSPCLGKDYITRNCKRRFRCLDFSPQEAFDKISERFFNE